MPQLAHPIDHMPLRTLCSQNRGKGVIQYAHPSDRAAKQTWSTLESHFPKHQSGRSSGGLVITVDVPHDSILPPALHANLSIPALGWTSAVKLVQHPVAQRGANRRGMAVERSLRLFKHDSRGTA